MYTTTLLLFLAKETFLTDAKVVNLHGEQVDEVRVGKEKSDHAAQASGRPGILFGWDCEM